MIYPKGDKETQTQFEKDVKDQHLVYYYDAHNPETGEAEKWKYEMHFYSEDRINYKIHGGPMAGRVNFQQADYQMIRAGELWQCNWLEETGTICSLVWDIPRKRITTLLNFSKGHWTQAEAAHGDKRNPEDLERWRGLAKVGTQMERHILNEQADIAEHFKGKGDLQDVDPSAPTL